MGGGKCASFITAVETDSCEAEKRTSFITAVETDSREGVVTRLLTREFRGLGLWPADRSLLLIMLGFGSEVAQHARQG